ncbi:MAG: hypothetical protein AAF702_07030 [Chloroflexota bacterium]
MKRYSKIFLVLALLTLASVFTYNQGVWAQSGPSDSAEIAQNGRGNRGDRPNVIDREVVKAAIASSLNMTVEQLDAAKEAGQSWEEIAETQGVPYENVVAAAKASMTAQVNQALANGEINQEQATRMLERIDNMDSLKRGRGSRGDRGNRADRANVIDREVVKSTIASTLNMTVEQLDAAKEAGQSWEEIAETQGVPYENVVAAAKVSMTAQVNQALANGEIDQEQADRLLERIDNMDSLERGRGNRGDQADLA